MVPTPSGSTTKGRLSGYYVDANGTQHGFIDTNGSLITVDDPLGTEGTQLTGINNSGELVGQYVDSSGVHHDFVASAVAPALSFIGPVIDAAADTAWPVTVSGLGE